MLTWEDCLALCELTEDEIAAIAEHEHVTQMAAAEFGIGELREVRPGGNLDRPASWSAVLAIDDIAVAEQILREENRGRNVAVG